jgi:hypothetical protein
MGTVTEHYDRHLGPIYSWMVGDVTVAMERNLDELRQLDVVPRASKLAVDLGAGQGMHAIPLARLGFSVLALDTCTRLLEELRQRAGALSLRCIPADLLSFRQYAPGPVDAILCMGDTLPHLPTLPAVDQLLGDVSAVLADQGAFVATFRDYVSRTLEGESRFIPVRSDADRVLTCFLEYEADRVIVYDLLQEHGETGWQLSVSSYPKLRIDPAWVEARLAARGLSVALATTPSGMIRVVARRR